MNHLVDQNETATKKEKFYAMASKAELLDQMAKIRFERPAYGKYYGRRKNNADRPD